MKTYQCIVCGFIYDETRRHAGRRHRRPAPSGTTSRPTGNARIAALPRPISRWWKLFKRTRIRHETHHHHRHRHSPATRVAREFRKLDKITPLIIITADDGGFYSKPMLSNAFAQRQACRATGDATAQRKWRRKSTPMIMTGTRVNGIDTAGRTVGTSAGAFDYAKLVLAVGAQPIRLAIDGNAADQVLSVNHVDDYALFRERIAYDRASDGARHDPRRRPDRLRVCRRLGRCGPCR